MNVTVKDTLGQEAGTCFQGCREPIHGGSDPDLPGRGRPSNKSLPPASDFHALGLLGEKRFHERYRDYFTEYLSFSGRWGQWEFISLHLQAFLTLSEKFYKSRRDQ